MQIYKYLINPYVLYAIVWMFTLSIYSLGWTSLYPPICNDLIFFICVTSLLSLLFGIYKIKRNSYVIVDMIPNRSYFLKLKSISFVLTVLLFLEFVIYGSFPLFSYIMGLSNMGDYVDFGIPFVHVIVMSAFEFIQIFCFHCILTCVDNSLKKKFVKMYLWNFLILSLVMNRGILMFTLFGSILIFFMVKRRFVKYFFRLLLLLFAILFSFGLLGNLRSGENLDAGNEFLLDVGGATEKFRDSIIPSELFWSYIYITSPLSNVQYNIDKAKVNYEIEDIIYFFVNSCLPQTISKRLQFPYKNGELNNDVFNTGTVYMKAYVNIGWLGMILLFIFMFIFVEINTLLISNRSSLFPSLLVIIDTIIIFNIFDNMFIFVGLVPAVLVAILMDKFNLFPLYRN